MPVHMSHAQHFLNLTPEPWRVFRTQAREAVEANPRRLQPSPSSVTEQQTSNRHWVRREDVSAVTQHIIQHLPVKTVQPVRPACTLPEFEPTTGKLASRGLHRAPAFVPSRRHTRLRAALDLPSHGT